MLPAMNGPSPGCAASSFQAARVTSPKQGNPPARSWSSLRRRQAMCLGYPRELRARTLPEPVCHGIGDVHAGGIGAAAGGKHAAGRDRLAREIDTLIDRPAQDLPAREMA